MFFQTLMRSKSVRLLTTLSIFFLLYASSVRAELGLRLPQPKPFLASIVYTHPTSPASIGDVITNTIVYYPNSFTHTISIENAGLWISITQRAYGQNIRTPRILTLKEYLSQRSHIEATNQWGKSVLSSLSGLGYQSQITRGITIESPEIQSRAFQQIFGGETLSLNVTGQITIDGSMRNEKRSQDNNPTYRAPNTSFHMKQTQRFNVEGKIGENVSIMVDQDSERPFEFDNAFRLEYSSDEDGILKTLRAGNVSLSLPSTQFVTFSAQNSGLFGIKSELKIGKLDITAIASIEKGEKKKLSLTGGRQEENFKIHDYQYRRYTYFFLDSLYRTNYMTLYENGIHYYDPDHSILDINVYKSGNINDEIQGYAVLDPVNPDTSESAINKTCYNPHWIRLDPSEYYLNRELGFIALNTPVQDDEYLAVAYKDTLGTYGSIPAVIDATNNIFKLIKVKEQTPSDPTSNLEWKNVYYLGSRDIDPEGFDIKIYYKTPSGIDSTTTVINGEPKGYLNIFGLDNYNEDGEPKSNNIIDIDENILSLSRGELIFPHLRPFAPEEGEKNIMLPKDKWATAIYDSISDDDIHNASNFYLEINSSRLSPNYSLGFNVIEGTEEVFLNGTRLQKDVDYTINYTIGQIILLNKDATSPDANIEINYESQRMFAVDKKTLIGTRAEYTLWEESNKRSFIGATLLYLDQNTLDQRIRVGREAPMQNIVWGANAALQFKSNFLTRALNNLPFLEANTPSNVSLEAEIAQVIPNPNTLNSDATGDPDGVAYLDDFESAKRIVPLGIAYSGWRLSSPPTTYPDSAKSAYMYNKGRLIWYTPKNQVPIREIWPDREVTTNYGGSTTQNVLTLQFSPNDTIDNKNISWGGIQKALSSGYADQTNSRFIELWIQGNGGRLHIDLGQVSEDAIPNQSLNTEDKKIDGYFYNNILDEEEDTGIDGVFGNDPTDGYFHPHEEATIENNQATPYDFWDINNNGTKEPNEPWSYDDYQYDRNVAYYDQVNGTENSEAAFSSKYIDTEDMNGNGNVDLNNDYFEYSFDIDPTGPYIAGGHDDENGGWWLYRIPLSDPTKIVGDPEWSRIKHVRLWIDGVDQPTTVTFAEINLVGNEWKLLGVKNADDSTYQSIEDSTMTITVINTHDNPEYVPPAGVEGVIDPIQQIRSKEQSLVIKVNNLLPGATAVAQKQFYQSENLINYQTLKMYVHGGNHTHILSSDSVEFFLQLGSDTDNEHYYEIRFLVEDGWSPETNSIEVDFETLSRLKLEMQATGKDSISEVQPNGHTVTIRGNPSLTNVRWLIAGIQNRGSVALTDEIWLDELRISNVRKDKGVAMRISGNIALSDFMTINGNYTRKDADFHTLNEQFGRGSHTRGGNINTSIKLHKLLPTQWGISIPISANYSNSVQTPKFKPGSDILVNKNTTPDSILKNEIETWNRTIGMNISIQRQSKSRNFWIRHFVDPLSATLNYTQTKNRSPQIKHASNTGYTGSLSYSLSLNNQNYLEPFKWMGQNGILKKIAQIKFYYIPSNISFKYNGSDINNNSTSQEGLESNIYKANMTRNLSTKLQPFKALSFNYSEGLSSNMKNTRWLNIFSYMPGEPTSKTRTTETDLRPALFSWLTHNFKYSTNYRWTENLEMKSKGTGKNASVSTSFNFNGIFNPKRLVEALRKQSPGQGASPRRPVTRSQPEQEEDQSDNQDEEPSEKKPFPLFSLFSLMGRAVEKIEPISIKYTRSRSENLYGIEGAPSFAYQIGTSEDAGVTFSENVTQRPSIQKNQTFEIQTGFDITSRLSTDLKFNITNIENKSTQQTGSVKKSAFLLKERAIPFPNWSVQWRGLEKFTLFSRFAKSVSLSHTFIGNTTESWNGTPDDIVKELTSREFRPLLGLSLTLQNGMSANIQYTTTESVEQEKKFAQRRTKITSSNISVTLKYSKRGGFKIPFLGSTKLDNNIDFSLTYTRRSDKTDESATETSAYFNRTDSKNWSLQPSLTYTFSSTVRGGVNFEIGAREDKITGKTNIVAFGLNAVISLSGN